MKGSQPFDVYYFDSYYEMPFPDVSSSSDGDFSIFWLG